MSTTPPIRWRRTLAVLAVAPLVLAAAACGGESSADDNSSGSDSSNAGAVADELRLGYFPTSPTRPPCSASPTAPSRRRSATPLETQTFNAGPAAIEALLAGAIDATFIGPNPAINALGQSRTATRSASSPAPPPTARQLVVKPEINSAADLQGKTLATPQLGGTQDVALRSTCWPTGSRRRRRAAATSTSSTRRTRRRWTCSSRARSTARWLPEPWASRLVLEAGGKVLVDEKTLWPDGRSS